MVFSVSIHKPPTWDFLDHHGPTWALRTVSFSLYPLSSSALLEQLSLLVWKRLFSLPFYHRVQLQSTQVQLSIKGFITQYQAAYRYLETVREPGLDATQQKWTARKNAQSCHGNVPAKVHHCCHLSLSSHKTTPWAAEPLLWPLQMNSTPPWPCFPEACGLIEFTFLFQVSWGKSAWLKLVTCKGCLK